MNELTPQLWHTPDKRLQNKSVSCMQNTMLDMESLGPAVDDAFAAAGILLRPEVAEARTAGQQPESESVSIARHVSRRLHRIASQWWLR